MNEFGDDVAIAAMVTNVADGLVDSAVELDFAEETNFMVSSAGLFEDNSPLEFLSAAPHPYFPIGGVGHTLVNGTFLAFGHPADRITDITLEEVIQRCVDSKSKFEKMNASFKRGLTGEGHQGCWLQKDDKGKITIYSIDGGGG